MAEPPRNAPEEDEEDGDTWVEVPTEVVSSWRQLSLSGSVSSESLEDLVQPHLSSHIARHNRSMSTGNLSALVAQSGKGGGRAGGSLDGLGNGGPTTASRFSPFFRPTSPQVGDASPRVASSSGCVQLREGRMTWPEGVPKTRVRLRAPNTPAHPSSAAPAGAAALTRKERCRRRSRDQSRWAKHTAWGGWAPSSAPRANSEHTLE